MKQRHKNKFILIYLAGYFILGLFFLDTFPFMHSDETWLSGLTRAMMHSGVNTTEPFFDLLPRYPHAIKLLFHVLQMPFIALGGYQLFSVRLFSLICGTATLFIFYKLCRRWFKDDLLSLAMTVILSLDIQFIYASHFARQDIIITFGIVAVIYYITANADNWKYGNDAAAGVLTGLFIGFHPNSLMVALTAAAMYLFYIPQRKMKLNNLGVLIGVTAGCAALFIGISYMFDAEFFPHYFKYGSTLGIDMSMMDKIRSFPGYFIKLFARISGTYYTPPVQPQLILFSIAIAGTAVFSFFKREMLKILLPVLAVCVGIIVIGRYSQPAVIMLFPLCWLLVFTLVNQLPRIGRFVVLVLLGIAMIINSVAAISPYLNSDYQDYLDEIQGNVPSDSRTLGNLNTEYAFDNGALLDIRNLDFLDEQKITFEEYVTQNGIEYIIYPEEMDFIFERRPVWNIIYGNVVTYYKDMTDFLNEKCTKTTSFTSPYAMRIARYMDKQDWTVTIYHVDCEDRP